MDKESSRKESHDSASQKIEEKKIKPCSNFLVSLASGKYVNMSASSELVRLFFLIAFLPIETMGMSFWNFALASVVSALPPL